LNGCPELAEEKDGRIPAAARFSLSVHARHHVATAAEIRAILLLLALVVMSATSLDDDLMRT
jgi:hypothetical protein